MSHTIERYVIKHISGSKINQVEEFDFSKNELTIGRAAGSDIQFDPEREVVVSREHGKIVKESDDPPKFTISDNNSRNGIFVNKVRVKGTVELNPGDEIQLGSNGPTFSFDIFPRPQDMMAATRMVEIPTSIKPTTISQVEEVSVPAVAEPVKTGLGKQTVERMLVAERKKSSNRIFAVLGGLVVVLGILGFVFKDSLFGKKSTTVITNVVGDTTNKNKKNVSAISKENKDRVVKIEFSWELYDATNGKPLWHEYMLYKDKAGQTRYAGLYIQNSQGRIEPYIVPESENIIGIPVGMNGASGSGFVVSEDGFIMTNRHVAASWNTLYDIFPSSTFPGILVDGNKNVVKDASGNPYMVSYGDVYGWVPAKCSMINGRYAEDGKVQGRNKYINVIFSGTALRRPAQLTTASDNHDVALIKVEIPQALSPVKLKDNYTEIQEGDQVTVMGYPGVAPEQYVVRKSNDPFNTKSDWTTIPTPTVTPGNIGRIIEGSSEKDNLYSSFGDSYQLTINATGGGNSGGPMFDDEGNVIGIYYAGKSDQQGTRISFAVPIKYGMELMGIKKLTNRQ